MSSCEPYFCFVRPTVSVTVVTFLTLYESTCPFCQRNCMRVGWLGLTALTAGRTTISSRGALDCASATGAKTANMMSPNKDQIRMGASVDNVANPIPDCPGVANSGHRYNSVGTQRENGDERTDPIPR